MSGGVKTAVDQVLDANGTMDEVVQAGLFEELEPEETGSLTAPSPLSAALPSAGRKPGRPKGAKNRRTEAVTAWLLSQHRHPLSVMMEAYSMTPKGLAKAIGIGDVTDAVLMDLLKLQLRMAEAVAPYVAQKMPQAVQVAGAPAFTLQFGGDLNLSRGVSSPAHGQAGGDDEQDLGDGMSIRLGTKSDG